MVKKTTPTPSTSSTTTTAPSGKPAGSERKPSKHQVADDLTAAFWKLHGKGRAQSFIAIRGVIRTAIRNGMARDDCAHALHRIASQGRSVSGATLDIALGEIRRGGQHATAPQTAPRHIPEEELEDALTVR